MICSSQTLRLPDDKPSGKQLIPKTTYLAHNFNVAKFMVIRFLSPLTPLAYSSDIW